MVLPSLCQNPKNTIDPETMINQYGADAVRWFILSDSPPDKDVQWSDAGVDSANKFYKKYGILITLYFLGKKRRLIKLRKIKLF